MSVVAVAVADMGLGWQMCVVVVRRTVCVIGADAGDGVQSADDVRLDVLHDVVEAEGLDGRHLRSRHVCLLLDWGMVVMTLVVTMPVLERRRPRVCAYDDGRVGGVAPGAGRLRLPMPRPRGSRVQLAKSGSSVRSRDLMSRVRTAWRWQR